MTTLPDTDDNKDSTSDDNKEGMDITEISNLQINDTKHSKPNSPSLQKKRKRKRCKKVSNSIDINSVLKQSPMKRAQKKQELPSLTGLCLEIIFKNIAQYDSFDFMPQDLACELLVMVIDRQAMNRDTVRPFLNTKHELIKQFCKKHVRLSRLPPVISYGCRGFDR